MEGAGGTTWRRTMSVPSTRFEMILEAKRSHWGMLKRLSHGWICSSNDHTGHNVENKLEEPALTRESSWGPFQTSMEKRRRPDSCGGSGIGRNLLDLRANDQMVKDLPALPENWVQSLGQEDPLEKGMTIHSSTLAWRIPWIEESDGL